MVLAACKLGWPIYIYLSEYIESVISSWYPHPVWRHAVYVFPVLLCFIQVQGLMFYSSSVMNQSIPAAPNLLPPPPACVEGFDTSRTENKTLKSLRDRLIYSGTEAMHVSFPGAVQPGF